MKMIVTKVYKIQVTPQLEIKVSLILLETEIKFLIRSLMFYINKMSKKKNQINKRKLDQKGLVKLKNNKNTIIKEADKGESVAIMSTKHYCKMLYDQLNHNQFTEKLIASMATR